MSSNGIGSQSKIPTRVVQLQSSRLSKDTSVPFEPCALPDFAQHQLHHVLSLRDFSRRMPGHTESRLDASYFFLILSSVGMNRVQTGPETSNCRTFCAAFCRELEGMSEDSRRVHKTGSLCSDQVVSFPAEP